MRHSPAVIATMPANRITPTLPRRIIHATPSEYRPVTRVNQRLNAVKKRPGLAPCSRLSIATHSDGVSVSATMPEITTAMEMVTANWR